MAQKSKQDLHLPVIALILAASIAATLASTVALDPEEPEWNFISGTEYRSKRSAAGANVVDEATTAKRGERDLYRLLRTLKKRGGPGRFGNRFMQWLVHKRSDLDTMVAPNNVMASWPKIRLPPRESRARDVPVHSRVQSNFVPLHQTPFQMPEEQGSKLHHFLRSLLRDNDLGDLLDYY